MRAVVFMVCGVVGAACVTEPVENVRPVARLRTPVIAPSRLPVTLDATRSEDVDGTLTAFTYVFGDGSPATERTDAVIQHVFPAPGRYSMQLTVRDDRGAEASVTREITLVDRYTPPYCSQQEPCAEHQRCESVDGGGVCFEETP